MTRIHRQSPPSVESKQERVGQEHVGSRSSRRSVYGTSRAVSNLLEALNLALAEVGSPAELAKVLAITPSHMSRLRKGKAGISAELSLRLSGIIGRPMIQGLRDDGHVDLAELLQPLFDPKDDERVARMRKMEFQLSRLAPGDYKNVKGLVASLAKAARQRKTTRPKSVRE
jgi:plasmid maintenance system antidote protein VapI